MNCIVSQSYSCQHEVLLCALWSVLATGGREWWAPSGGRAAPNTHRRQVCVFPPQMMSSDNDFCFMATDDIMMELQSDSIKPDESGQKVVKSVLWLLEGKNADLAVRR